MVELDSSHVVIIGLLIVILIVVVMMRNRNHPSAAALRRQRAMAAMGRTAGILGERRRGYRESDTSSASTENFNWSHASDILEQQAQQKKELRDASFPLNTIFAKLGTMAETCAHDNTPQCVEFRKFASAMYHQ